MAEGAVIALWSPKGGVGKTLLSAALALRLAERHRTVIVDGDADCPDLVSLLQSPSLPNIGTWPGVVEPNRVEEHLVRRSSRLFFLPGPSRFIDEAVLSGDAMEAALGSLAAAGMLVVVDCSTNLRDSTLVALDMADHILLPVTLDLLALTPLRRVERELEVLRLPASKFRVVINRVTDTKEITPDDVRELSPFPVIAQVPSSRQAAQAVNRGDLEAAVGPASAIGKAVSALAAQLFPGEEARSREPAPTLLGRLRLLTGKEGV